MTRRTAASRIYVVALAWGLVGCAAGSGNLRPSSTSHGSQPGITVIVDCIPGYHYPPGRTDRCVPDPPSRSG